MPSAAGSFLMLAVWSCATASLHADEILLLVDPVPPDRLVVAPVDLTGAARWCKADAASPEGIRAFTLSDGREAPFQFVPSVDYNPQERIAGTAVLQVPAKSDGRVRLELGSAGAAREKPWDGTVTTPAFVVRHDPKKMGGLPWSISFPKTGKQFDGFHWNDRVYDRQQGWFGLRNDPEPTVELVAQGPLCTVVRVRARYMKSPDEAPPSKPEAVYDWHYFHDRPLVFVRAAMTQEESYAWPEHHFLELNYPREAFPRWAGGEPLREGEFTVTNKTFGLPQWGALLDGKNAIAMLACGQALFYDAGAGTYLHAHGDAAWAGWRDERPQFSAWLWIGTADDPISVVRAASQRPASYGGVAVTVDAVHEKIQAALDAARENPTEPVDEHSSYSRAEVAVTAAWLESVGRLEDAARVLNGQMPPGLSIYGAGDLGMILESTSGGMRLVNLFDLHTQRSLLATRPLPIFELTFRHAETGEEILLTADRGWEAAVVGGTQHPDDKRLTWSQPEDARLSGLRVTVEMELDRSVSAVRWGLDVAAPKSPWHVWRIVFPQVAVADMGEGGKVFFPRAAGEVQGDLWKRSFRYTGTYPSGWTSM
ncbi:MAG: hypothetical protein ACYTG0_33160, partial [Planctomycetota bacterium]